MGCATVDPAEDWLVSSLVLQSVSIRIDASSPGPFNPLYSGNPYTSTFTNSVDCDEMQHYLQTK